MRRWSANLVSGRNSSLKPALAMSPCAVESNRSLLLMGKRVASLSRPPQRLRQTCWERVKVNPCWDGRLAITRSFPCWARLGRQIALKLLPAEFTRDKERFEREAQAASALNHPNILTIYEVGQADGTTFIATEFIDGQTLRQRMAGKRMKLAKKLDVAIQVSNALAGTRPGSSIGTSSKKTSCCSVTVTSKCSTSGWPSSASPKRCPAPFDSRASKTARLDCSRGLIHQDLVILFRSSQNIFMVNP
ncbi:MAG: hypothetical protein EXQ58_02265 [Acidobacteria bacterium]|nr:hypothetical protein [Acidobacteriota bacterium]